MRRRAAAFVAAGSLLMGSPAFAELGDPIRSEKLFQYCFSCHSVERGETTLQGPNLRGIVGSRIAARDGFAYSPSLRAFAEREAAGARGFWTGISRLRTRSFRGPACLFRASRKR